MQWVLLDFFPISEATKQGIFFPPLKIQPLNLQYELYSAPAKEGILSCRLAWSVSQTQALNYCDSMIPYFWHV